MEIEFIFAMVASPFLRSPGFGFCYSTKKGYAAFTRISTLFDSTPAATKEDIAKFQASTKEELAKLRAEMATKEDLVRMTKELDEKIAVRLVKHFYTKQEVDQRIDQQINKKFKSLAVQQDD